MCVHSIFLFFLSVDVLAEISSLCKGHNCQLILAGLPKVVRPALIAGGVKPTRLNSHLSFVSDLEAALGKAEDELLKFVGHNEEKTIRVAEELKHKRKISMADFGLRHALNSIDEQHNIALAKHLKELEKYTFPRDLEAGDQLNDDGSESTLPRGLYFIEVSVVLHFVYLLLAGNSICPLFHAVELNTFILF